MALGKLGDFSRSGKARKRSVLKFRGRTQRQVSYFSSVNRLGPSDPWRSLKPLTGILDVPVVNWSKRLFFSAGHARTAFQNHCTTSSPCWYPR